MMSGSNADQLTHAYLFASTRLSVIFGVLQRRFILNASVNFRFVKCTIKLRRLANYSYSIIVPKIQ